MSVPTSNTEYTNHNNDATYGSVNKGSIIIPSGAIVPYANLVAYNNSITPSGFVYCDGYFYNPDDPVYTDLFNAIGYSYGLVPVVTSYVGVTPVTTNYFGVPNLMGASNYSYKNPVTGTTYNNLNSGLNYCVSGGQVSGTNGAQYEADVKDTTKINLTSEDQLYSHSHAITQNAHSHQLFGYSTSIATRVYRDYPSITPGNVVPSQYRGYYDTASSSIDISIASTGQGADIPLPPTPNFVMPYLIKL